MKLLTRLTLTLIALFPLTAGTAQDARDCERDCIIAIVSDYVTALLDHDPTGQPFADNLRATENGVTTEPGRGVWQTISARGGYSQIFVDDGLQDAVFFGAFSEGDDPLLLAIRFRIEDRKITEIENLVSRPDARNGLINRHQLREPNPAFEIPLPPEQRLTRNQLIAYGHAYFDGIQFSSDAGVPMHRECLRRENGVVLLRNQNPQTEPCPAGFQRFNYITSVRDRRVAVVDSEHGLVLMWAFFDVPGNVEVEDRRGGPSDVGGANAVDTRRIPRSLYIAELFRVVEGGIRDIDAVMFNLDLGAKSGWE